MTNYNLKDYNNFNEVHTMMACELNDLLATSKVNGRFGEGTILSIGTTVSSFGNGFIAYIEFATEIKQIAINIALKSGAITMAEDKVQIVNEFMAELDRLTAEQKEIDRQHAEELAAIRAAAIEAEKERQKKAKAEAAFEKRKEATLAKLSELTSNKLVIGDNLYAAIGWIAKNMTSISAAMPDYAEKWFRGIFGDVKARVVDQSKRSPSGWISQWGLSLTIHLNSKCKDNIPMILRQYTDRNQAAIISDTQFVFTLLDDYGFKIGSKKEQDLNEIRRYIPDTAMADFEAGLAA